MAIRPEKIASPLERIDTALVNLQSRSLAGPIERWRIDAAALRFHLRSSGDSFITVILGGTGTGKSTLVNRLIGSNITATSFKRTFTAGPVAVISSGDLPSDWLGVEHIAVTQSELPAQGRIDALIIVRPDNNVAHASGVIVDTPDLDGDQPLHHAQADRAFRWAQRIVFVVTPEKYQMTELLPYYRLARRYELPALFVMNKCEESAVIEDFQRQLAQRDWPGASVFVVPRDDAGYDAPTDSNLDALRLALTQPVTIDTATRQRGIANRTGDVVTRLADQVIAPMNQARKEADQLVTSLRAMESAPVGIDVNPITDQLRRRLQQRSVLYLMGPQRVLDRVRQVPTLLARLPRATWDWVMRGDMPSDVLDPKVNGKPNDPPDYRAMLADQFTVLRSRIDDVLRSNDVSKQWITEDADAYAASLIDPSSAGSIADEEIDRLRQWLETRWNATPRDTRMLQALVKFLPGGKKITRWSEAAPYLIAAGLVVHHALFGMDLIVLGGYSLATWLTERISNEVASHTRATNRKIADRFERLAHEQIQRVCQWIDGQAPSTKELEHLVRLADELVESAS
jgi:hypothetical protein